MHMTEQDADSLLAELARLDAKITELEGRRAAALERIRTTYEAKLKPLHEAAADITAKLRRWAKRAAPAWDGRSIRLPHGELGWRLHPPAVEPLRGHTWEEVVDLLREAGESRFLRVRYEANREALIDAGQRGEDLSPYMVRLIQRESFYAAPKLD